ncbi:Conserved hypothetical protein [Shewanella piezotolerans WP3]|uniref:Protein ImuA n=1 Tax=Shewanella piezotolerans (strain WP3 / JCM 13877) TaxID=225849 RepID=B8CNU8_SHEPW|nr:translesion DNA synthesis-associated protein ImuA [Shewanella piezotolerans]ACJ29068.1 Conserved hypothetical protein [Shewanella piezotolerans WP3]
MGRSSAKAYSVFQDTMASERVDSVPLIIPAEDNASSLGQLLARQDIWRGQQWQQQQLAYPTGFSLLDVHLADNGWPQIGVCEVLCDGVGQGELSMVLPMLSQLIGQGQSSIKDAAQEQDSMVMLVAPPHIPSAQALLQQGLELARLIWIDTEERKERLWAIEQALSNGSVPLVLAWLDNLSTTEARRLQLAAEKGESLCMLYLPTRCAQLSHPVNLRLALQRQFFSARNNVNHHDHADSSAAASMLKLVPKQAASSPFFSSHLGMTEVNIIKRRGGWPSPMFSLPLLPPHIKESLLGVDAYPMQNTLQEVSNDVEPHSCELFTQAHNKAPFETLPMSIEEGLADYSVVFSRPQLPITVSYQHALINVTNARIAMITLTTTVMTTTRVTRHRTVNRIKEQKGFNLQPVYQDSAQDKESALSLEPIRRLSLQATGSLRSSLKSSFSEFVQGSIKQGDELAATSFSNVGDWLQDTLEDAAVSSTADLWAEPYYSPLAAVGNLSHKIH